MAGAVYGGVKFETGLSSEVDDLEEEVEYDKDESKDESNKETKDYKDLFGGGDKQSNIKNIVVHSFF